MVPCFGGEQRRRMRRREPTAVLPTTAVPLGQGRTARWRSCHWRRTGGGAVDKGLDGGAVEAGTSCGGAVEVETGGGGAVEPGMGWRRRGGAGDGRGYLARAVETEGIGDDAVGWGFFFLISISLPLVGPTGDDKERLGARFFSY